MYVCIHKNDTRSRVLINYVSYIVKRSETEVQKFGPGDDGQNLERNLLTYDIHTYICNVISKPDFSQILATSKVQGTQKP